MRRFLSILLAVLVGFAIGHIVTKPDRRVPTESPRADAVPVDFTSDVVMIDDGGSVAIYRPHCVTIGNERVYSTGAPEGPVKVIRFDAGRVQAGYTRVNPASKDK